MTVRLTKEGMRAARAILGLTMQELAPRLGVSPTTLNVVEKGEAVRASTETKIIAALASLGVEILNGDAPGARMKIKTAEG